MAPVIILSPEQDSWGQALVDHYTGTEGPTLMLESAAGHLMPAMSPDWFFEPFKTWHRWEQAQLAAMSGPVLDLGCGAGRASLYLENRGLEVTAVDHSPGAVQVCRDQGLTDVRLLDFAANVPDDKPWHTILMLCGNLGLAGTWEATQALLATLFERSAPDAVLLADTVDPTVGADDKALAYQAKQEAAGGYIGDLELRLSYGDTIGPWFGLMNLRASDAQALVDGTGWQLADHRNDGFDQYLRLEKPAV